MLFEVVGKTIAKCKQNEWQADCSQSNVTEENKQVNFPHRARF